MSVFSYALTLFLTVFSTQLAAADTNYQVELVGFTQKSETNETFTQRLSQINWPTNELLTELSSYSNAPATLGNTVSELADTQLYRPLFHYSWLQAPELGKFAPVHIKTSDGQFNGYVQLSYAPALQLLVDIEYTPITDAGGEPFIYRLDDTHQVNLGESYYLDHPKFGIIAKISLP